MMHTIMHTIMRWFQWARCRLVGWHTPYQFWRLATSENDDRPLYWVCETRCQYCDTYRPNTRTLYRWQPEHGTGAEPLPPPRKDGVA